MDQDFYIEETHPLKAVLLIIVVLALLGYGVYWYYQHYLVDKIYLNKVTVELGEELPTDINVYIKGKNVSDYKLDVSSVMVDENNLTNSVGEYSYKVTNNNRTLKGKIYVKDTTKPVVEVKTLTVGVNEEFSPSEFVTKCEDLSLPCVIKYNKPSDENLNEKEGTYNLKIVIKDSEGNEVLEDVSLIVTKDSSLKEIKEKDLEYDHISIDEVLWNKTYTLKLEKAVDSETSEYEKLISDVTVKEYAFEKTVTNKEIIIVYNKYDYVIGFSLKYTFEDGSNIFITNEEPISEVADEESTEN